MAVEQHSYIMVADMIETEMIQHEFPKLCAMNTKDPLTHDQFGILLPREISLKLFVDERMNENTRSDYITNSVNCWLDYD